MRHETGFVLQLGNMSAPDTDTTATTVEITVENYYITYSEYDNDAYYWTVAIDYSMSGEDFLVITQVEYTLMPITPVKILSELFF